MGNYSELYLDKYYFAWKYEVPSFLSFFFRKEMFYKTNDNRDDGEEYTENTCEEIGYKCTVSESIEILNKYGYDFHRIVEVYSSFFDILSNSAEQQIFDSIVEQNKESSEEELELKFSEYIKSYKQISKEEELRDFCNELSNLIESSQSKEYIGLKIIDFEKLQMYLIGKELDYSPWILRISGLFGWDMLREYSEILSMFCFRLLLESLPKEAIVKLDLKDIIDEEEEIKEVHSELASKLVDKINLYNSFFEPLITKEKYIKAKGLKLFNRCIDEESSYKKGQLLEELIELVFTSNKSLQVSSSRVKTGDEEIDLVIINNMTTSFWTSFGSMFFVECKNWSDKVGAKEVRDFETKLRNHNNVTRLGFFVSINGFSREVVNHLKRIGRENYHIVLIDKNALLEYLNGTEYLFEWLRKKVEKIY